MARHTRLEVLNAMVKTGLVPVFHHGDLATARSIVDALSGGGAHVIEFTNRDDHAFEVFSELEHLCAAEYPHVILGAGTVVDEATAATYLNLGASFIVGPSIDEGVARVCNRRKVAYVPGTATPTEIARAHELGSEIVKVFPGGQVGGPGYIKAVLGPIPWASLMPTGGVDTSEESLSAWFDAGVTCVGIGSKLVSKDLVAQRNWEVLRQRTADAVATIARIR
ncbi:MAG: bifunctional 4-hydroxy-2-oxoglutarate aldolase/2-dehydro-3-deoxy-phosphogluconate aldolase [Acidimicrobiia bacterium]|nr:bifunctional 4-hydroxy-2-oxoglutarate aldolase/2-dehydro-3-deoxy-phosphogluconate aldolase [Acidimicrobiia bacterium]